jgi:hypothetical protein
MEMASSVVRSCSSSSLLSPASEFLFSALYFRPFPGVILEGVPEAEKQIADSTDDSALIDSFARHYR